ncbi:hypothetical protein AND_003664 [Anopheles darlingi]|uniref:G-protein coupled receptors family 1 profile domain-containing protein n=1 Tax=Anopheles darlingi TaxID=43151 RepID=W5JP97_ANODA|nr:hypothetical protein AND_003664 [Anopheles darlingi]
MDDLRHQARCSLARFNPSPTPKKQSTMAGAMLAGKLEERWRNAEEPTNRMLHKSVDGTGNETVGPFEEYELFYRHSYTMTAVYCVAYFIVFIVGLVGNSFVIAVVFRAPRMRTVTNFFIVNLAVADVLVIVFCLPATLMSNIFVQWRTRPIDGSASQHGLPCITTVTGARRADMAGNLT